MTAAASRSSYVSPRAMVSKSSPPAQSSWTKYRIPSSKKTSRSSTTPGRPDARRCILTSSRASASPAARAGATTLTATRTPSRRRVASATVELAPRPMVRPSSYAVRKPTRAPRSAKGSSRGGGDARGSVRRRRAARGALRARAAARPPPTPWRSGDGAPSPRLPSVPHRGTADVDPDAPDPKLQPRSVQASSDLRLESRMSTTPCSSLLSDTPVEVRCAGTPDDDDDAGSRSA